MRTDSYLGTATYDAPKYRDNQTVALVEAGCVLSALDITNETPSGSDLEAAVIALLREPRHAHLQP